MASQRRDTKQGGKDFFLSLMKSSKAAKVSSPTNVLSQDKTRWDYAHAGGGQGGRGGGGAGKARLVKKMDHFLTITIHRFTCPEQVSKPGSISAISVTAKPEQAT
jgi:hypothetical protein